MEQAQVSASPSSGAVDAQASSQVHSAGTDWTTGLTEDSRGYVQNKGFQNPAMVIDSYRSLEKLLGAPKERLLRLPEKDDAPEWGDVYNRLGRPATANDYKIDVPPEMGGDGKFADWAKTNFHELGLSKKQAEGLAGRWNEYQKNVMSQSNENLAYQNQQQEASLKREWGAAFDQNMNMAKRAAQTFGMDGATIDKLESAMGFSGIMKFMHSLGSKLGEDSFVQGGASNQSGFGILSPEAAKNRINSLRGDPEFVKRYTAGDVSAKDEMFKLHQFAYPE
ncbi:hypothetical protein [Caudoviricetes sp.]|nr:hypothetical protein [Caudoviricetes sp.]